ncbi:hypothetical protein F1D05_19895 [Kribbella qitaiheensis]|uniref:Uncharacterized protein n=1 Tax=Kribbella qitaiheensis TaxID=1544730 RepID=A0A7G6X0K2_9ACTN|nr:hypothetical protein F1D05_19895 [Kribbella qitaiheensis]
MARRSLGAGRWAGHLPRRDRAGARAERLRVHWVEDYFWAHLAGGEVHCATNALRDTKTTDTWLAQRVMARRWVW